MVAATVWYWLIIALAASNKSWTLWSICILASRAWRRFPSMALNSSSLKVVKLGGGVGTGGKGIIGGKGGANSGTPVPSGWSNGNGTFALLFCPCAGAVIPGGCKFAQNAGSWNPWAEIKQGNVLKQVSERRNITIKIYFILLQLLPFCSTPGAGIGWGAGAAPWSWFGGLVSLRVVVGLKIFRRQVGQVCWRWNQDRKQAVWNMWLQGSFLLADIISSL